jgi:hypothetical protein
METLTAINTELGAITGRDAIFLDKVSFASEKEVCLHGSFSSRYDNKYFVMNFSGLLFFSAIELDFNERDTLASLAIVENSEKIARFRATDHSSKTSDEHQHYYIVTYDSVFEIVSDQFVLIIEGK